MHDIMNELPPILAITVMTVLGTTAVVRIIVGVGKVVIDAINHHGGHHGR